MKSKVNLIIDLILLVLMSAATGIGLLMKYVLLSGKERSLVYERNVDLYLFSWDRHQWGTLHLWIGYALLVFLVLHIVLHWKQICLIASSLIPHRIVKNVLALLFAIFCILLILFAFLLPIEIQDSDDSHDHPTKQRKNKG